MLLLVAAKEIENARRGRSIVRGGLCVAILTSVFMLPWIALLDPSFNPAELLDPITVSGVITYELGCVALVVGGLVGRKALRLSPSAIVGFGLAAGLHPIFMGIAAVSLLGRFGAFFADARKTSPRECRNEQKGSSRPF